MKDDWDAAGLGAFRGCTREDIRRMPMSELDRRGAASMGPKDWFFFRLRALLPRVILLAVLLVMMGIYRIIEWIAT